MSDTNGNGKRNGKPETSAKTPAEVGRVKQPHGGALSPGNPGNKGNKNATGRVPEHSHLRTHCRGSFAERIPVLEAVADGTPLSMTIVKDGESQTIQISATIKERVQAIETLGKYGGVDKLAIPEDDQPEDRMTPERRL